MHACRSRTGEVGDVRTGVMTPVSTAGPWVMVQRWHDLLFAHGDAR